MKKVPPHLEAGEDIASRRKKDGMREVGMQLLRIIAEISRALSVLQSAFINITSFRRVRRLDGTQSHELQHHSTGDTSLGGSPSF